MTQGGRRAAVGKMKFKLLVMSSVVLLCLFCLSTVLFKQNSMIGTLERWSREPSSAASRNVEQASAQDLLDVHSQQEQEVPSNAREPDPRPATGVRVQRRRRVRGRYPRRVKYTDASVQELKGKQQLQGPGKEDLEVEPDSLGQLPDDEALSRLLSELDRVVLAKASIDKIYGHIYNHGNLAQPRAYLRTLRQYTGPASRICEIGFAGGHSATIFLHGLPQAEYQAFDMWDRPFYEDAALAKVRSMFPGRNITVTKGDSTVTVPKYKGTCDVIHIDGAHHAHFPAVDMRNMARLANPAGHLLFIDDCVRSFPAVLNAWNELKSAGKVVEYSAEQPEGWSFRGREKGWCIGAYAHGVQQPEGQALTKEIRPKKPSDEASAPFRMFLGLKFCNVGFGGKNCTQRLAVRPCGPRDDGCFYHPEYGTAVVSKERWLGAQAVEQETWDTRDTDEDRNAAHAVSYNGYAALPQELGDAIEIACGPFTQIKTILRTGRTVSSLTLLDPGAFHYMNSVRRSSYKNGLLKAPGVVANTVLSFPAEETPSLTHSFDTVVMINVIEHVLDAFTTFEKVYHMLRPGGLFLWHDRLWDGYQGRPGTGPRDGGALREFQLHPIRLKKSFADRFVQLFDPLFDSRDTPELRRLQNQGIYFIGRKRAGDTLPPPAPVADRVTVVLLTHPGSNRKNYLLRHLRSYHKMQIVAYIVLILNGADAPFDLEPFADKLILKAFSINSMNNRFRIEREVMTEAVLMVDDDVLLPPMTVACLHRHWSADKLRLFGMDPRALHRGEYKYNAHADGSYSAVVGKTMFFHRDYLSAYVADNAVQYYVNPEGANSTPPEELNFCEDLAMVVLIAAKSGKAPMAVDDHGMRADLDNNGDGLSLAKGWPEMRIKCIKWLTAHYGLKALPTERHRYQCPAALQPSGPATARFGSNLL